MIGKRGEERYISPYMFIIWALVAFSFITAVFIFYSGDADIRKLEDDVMINIIADCISNDGILKQEVLVEGDMVEGEIIGGYDLIDSCGLDREIFEVGDFYARVSIFDGEINELREPLEIGESQLEFSCNFQRKNDPFSICVKKALFLQSESKPREDVVVEIIASSRNDGEEI